MNGELTAPAVTIPSDRDVTYRLDGRSVTAGHHEVTPGRHHVRAVSGHDQLGRSAFGLTVRAAACDVGVTSTRIALGTPSVQVGKCTASTTSAVQVQAPVTTGVDYRVRRTAPSSSIATVRVTAIAQTGYRLSIDTTGWRRVDATHAVYRAQVAVPAGCPSAAAIARSTRAGANSRSIDQALRSAPCGSLCLGPVVPTPPSFRDDTCVAATGQRSGASYVIPSTSGVLYWVNGTNLDPGTYPGRDGSTVTVVTSAGSGYSLSGITQWTHTFADAPRCSGVGAADPKTSPGAGTTPSQRSQPAQHPADATTHTPAYTGAPVGRLLTAALLLLLLGSASCFAGTRRRPGTMPAESDPAGPCDATAPNGGLVLADHILATRPVDVSLSDPAVGSGRTPPRPGPAVGRVRRLSGFALMWRAALTPTDP